MIAAILQICASLRAWQLTCSYCEVPRLPPRFVAVCLLDFSVWKEGTILDTNSASGSTFLIVSAGSDERTQAWLGCTSQSGLPTVPHALTRLRFYTHPVRRRTDAHLVALTHREYAQETHPRKMLLKEYRICMPLTVEEVSFHLQICLVWIWKLDCSHICKTSGCGAPAHVAQHVVRQGSGKLQRLHFLRNVDSFWTHKSEPTKH